MSAERGLGDGTKQKILGLVPPPESHAFPAHYFLLYHTQCGLEYSVRVLDIVGVVKGGGRCMQSQISVLVGRGCRSDFGPSTSQKLMCQVHAVTTQKESRERKW